MPFSAVSSGWLSVTHIPPRLTPRLQCWTSNAYENLGNSEAGTWDQCVPFYYTGRQRMSGCTAEAVFPWCVGCVGPEQMCRDDQLLKWA